MYGSPAGIYVITNTATGEQYVGASFALENRQASHRCALTGGYHQVKRLQAAWNEHGASAFTFTVLELVTFDPKWSYDKSKDFMRGIEARWIHQLKPAYNTRRPFALKVEVGKDLWAEDAPESVA